MNSPFFTIAIPTYNRASVLPYSIMSALAQTLAPDEFEILVVDNNSTDETSAVIQRFADSHANIRVTREKQQGLNFSRNKAWNEAKGNTIVYIDDDAELCPEYLESLKKIVNEETSIGAVGGPIEVGWLGPVPQWYEPGLDMAFNHLYLGSYRRHIKYPTMIFGTNMAFPIAVLKAAGGFRTDLDRIGSHLLSGGEVEMILRIQREQRLRIIYDPALKVRHLVCPDRLSPEYLVDKAVWQGRSQFRVERLHPGSGSVVPAIMSLIESFARTILGRTAGSISEKVQRALARGYLQEWFSVKFGSRDT
jgi:glycosyltransferase involved in cell wall biosynthesis